MDTEKGKRIQLFGVRMRHNSHQIYSDLHSGDFLRVVLRSHVVVVLPWYRQNQMRLYGGCYILFADKLSDDVKPISISIRCYFPGR